MSDDSKHWPLALIADRYGGIYSGGEWLAISGITLDRFRIVMLGPHGDDPTAAEFWDDPPKWIAVGATPDAARKALKDPA